MDSVAFAVSLLSSAVSNATLHAVPAVAAQSKKSTMMMTITTAFTVTEAALALVQAVAIATRNKK